MADIAKLVARLELQSSQFQAEIEKTNKKLVKFQHDSNLSLKNIEEGFKSLSDVVEKFATGFGAALVVAPLVEFVNKAIEAGETLAKAATKSGIAVKSFSELAYAAQLSDIDVTSLSIALKKMQVSLSEASTGNKDVILTLGALGLKLSDIANQSPDKQFELLAERINQLKDPADKTRAAVQLFGKAGSDLLPLFSDGAQGIRKLRDEAVELGKTLDEQGAKSIHEADEALKKMKASGESLAQTLAIKLGPAIAALADGVRRLLGGTTDLENINQIKQLRDLMLSAKGGNLSLFSSEELKQLTAFNDQIAEASRVARLHAEPITHNRGLTLGGEGGGAQGFAASDAAIKAQEEAKKLAEAMDKIRVDSINKINSETAPALDAAGKKIAEFSEKGVKALIELGDQAGIEKKAILEFYHGLDDETKTSLEKQADQIAVFKQKVDLLSTSGIISKEESDKRLAEFKRSFDEMSIYADEAARNILDAFSTFLFDPFKDGLKGMLKGFLDVIRQMLAQAASAKLFEALFGKSKSGSGLGNVLGAIGGLLGFADGGRPPTNQPSLVGENGPEVFWPDSMGTVIPNGMLAGAGGGIVINNYNNFQAGSDEKLRQAMPALLQQTQNQAVAQILDKKRRGRL